MKDIIEIYVQPGDKGHHANVRGSGGVWAAHADDERTAAWRASLRHWFPKRPNGVLLYEEAHAVTVKLIGQHEYQATLEIPDKSKLAVQFKKDFTPLLVAAPVKPLGAPKTKRTKKARK